MKGVTVFARIFVHCPQETQALFAHAAANGVRLVRTGTTAAATPPAASGEHLLADFIGTVADSFDRIAHPGDRKLCAMGLIRATTLPVSLVLSHFELIACQVTGVWNALESGGDAVDPTLLVGGPAAEVLVDTLEVPVCMSEDAQGMLDSDNCSHTSVSLRMLKPLVDADLLCRHNKQRCGAASCETVLSLIMLGCIRCDERYVQQDSLKVGDG